MKTFAIIKPDAIERNLVGKIITRIENKGISINRIKSLVAKEDKIKEHYAHIVDKPFFPTVLNMFNNKNIIILELEGTNVVDVFRTMLGATNPDNAQPGTIRFDYGISPLRDNLENLVHGSDSEENAKREIQIWFGD